MNADSLYYGGVGTAGVKLIKQSYDILPNIKKGRWVTVSTGATC